MKRYSVLDIGGTFVKSAVMNEEGEILQEEKIPTPPQGNGEIFELIRQIVKGHEETFETMDGLALSVPGAVDVEDGYVTYAGSVTDIIGERIKEKLQDLQIPVEVENDANCAALAEKWKGNAQDSNYFLCATIGTGIGGAIFVNDGIFHGVDGMAGEFGIMILNTDGEVPDLLETKTFSRQASAWNLVHRLNTELTDEKTGEEWFELYDAGDEKVQKIVHHFYDHLAIGIINLMHLFAPEKILIGGGLSERKEIIPYVQAKVDQVPTSIARKVVVEPCKQKNKAGLIGALYHFLQRHK